MKQRIHTLLSFSFFILIMPMAQAQEIRTISLKEAIELAVKNSHSLEIAALKSQSADIRKEQAVLANLPIVTANANYTRLSNNIIPFKINFQGNDITLNPIILNQYANRISILQPIFQGLKNLHTTQAMQEYKQAAAMDRERELQDVKLNAIYSYFNLYKLSKANRLIDLNLTQTQKRIEDISNFKDAGLALNNDVMRSELQKTSLLVNKADIESAINIANFNLCILLGIETNKIIALDSSENIDAHYSNLASTKGSANYIRPEIKAQEYRIKAADYLLKASKSAYLPSINAFGNGYYNNPNQRVFPQEANFKSTWDLGLSLNWNITQLYTAKTSIQEAKNQKTQISIATAQIKEGISMEVNAAQQTLNVALLKIELAKKSIQQASENKRILDNRFKAQIALLGDVLEADQLLLQAETNLLNAQADAAIAHYKLERSLGTIK